MKNDEAARGPSRLSSWRASSSRALGVRGVKRKLISLRGNERRASGIFRRCTTLGFGAIRHVSRPGRRSSTFNCWRATPHLLGTCAGVDYVHHAGLFGVDKHARSLFVPSKQINKKKWWKFLVLLSSELYSTYCSWYQPARNIGAMVFMEGIYDSPSDRGVVDFGNDTIIVVFPLFQAWTMDKNFTTFIVGDYFFSFMVSAVTYRRSSGTKKEKQIIFINASLINVMTGLFGKMLLSNDEYWL